MPDHTQSWREAISGKLSIGDFVVDADANELHRDGRVTRLRPLLMDVLRRLAASAGNVVTREQLLDDVWPRRMVNDEVLSRAIAELRTALDDDAKAPRYVETLPKVGYRLIAAVARVLENRPAGEGAPVLENPPTGEGAPVPDAGMPTAASAPAPPAPAPARTTSPGMSGMSVKRWLILAAIVAPVLAWLLYWLITPITDTAERLSIQLARAQTFSADVDLELAPRFSPDGTAVLYAQGTSRQTKIVMRDLRGNVITTIEKPGAVLLSPVWGPWSRKIYFWQQTADGCSIVERDVLNRVDRQVVGCANEPQPRFDVYGDGKHIVVAWRARPEHPFGIARVNVADGTAEMLTSPQPGDGEDGLPRLSRDGTRMVFVRGGASHAKLWIMDPDNPSTARPLVSVEGLLYGVAWRGNHNDRLIVAADWPGFRALHLVDVATGNVELIGARGARFPDSSTNGDIMYEAATYRADLWLANPEDPAQSPQTLWPSSRYSNQPEFSPEGNRVVFTTNREGAEALFIGTIGGDAKKLVDSTTHRYIRAHWSPDGKSIYATRSPVTSRKSGPHEGVKIGVENRLIEVLTSLGAEIGDVRMLDDGTLLVAEASGNAMRLMRVINGVTSRLPLPLVTQFQVAGDDLAFTQPELKTLTRCRISTMQCAPLPVQIDESDVYHWHLAHDALWYRARLDAGAGPSKLMRFDLRDGGRKVFDFAPTGTGTAIATSRDGKKLIVVREAPTLIDLMFAPAASR